VLLNHWFEIYVIGSDRSRSSILSQALPAFGHRNRGSVSKACVSHLFPLALWLHFVPTVQRNGTRLPCGERDVGTLRAIIKGN
jgi:hypothetical protein